MFTNLINHYKSWFRSNNVIDPEFNKIYLALYQLQRDRNFIEITIEGDKAIYQSMILALDPNERTILIDELFPSEFIGLTGQKIHINVRQQAGCKLKFPSVVLERHSQNDVPMYVIQMPVSLDLDQRRSAFRLPITSQSTIHSSFVAPDYQTYNGQLRNVSCNGLCIEIEDDGVELLQYDDHLTNVTFAFAGQHIDCELAVRNVEMIDNDKREKSCWVLGAEFIDLATVEQRTLERSIMRIQRDRIKYSGDMEAHQAIA